MVPSRFFGVTLSTTSARSNESFSNLKSLSLAFSSQRMRRLQHCSYLQLQESSDSDCHGKVRVYPRRQWKTLAAMSAAWRWTRERATLWLRETMLSIHIPSTEEGRPRLTNRLRVRLQYTTNTLRLHVLRPATTIQIQRIYAAVSGVERLTPSSTHRPLSFSSQTLG